MRRDDDRSRDEMDAPHDRTGAASKDFPPSESVADPDAQPTSALGGLGGAAVGAAAGALAGPVGVAIGALAGGVGGWWAGHAVQAARELHRDEPRFREHHATLAHGGEAYDTALPAYQLGYLAGRNPEYASRTFDEIEERVRVGWTPEIARTHGEWREAREYVRAAYTMERERAAALRDREVPLRGDAEQGAADRSQADGASENASDDAGAEVAASAEEGEVVYPSELDALANGIPAEPGSEAVREFGIDEAEAARESASASPDETIVDPREGETQIGDDLRAREDE